MQNKISSIERDTSAFHPCSDLNPFQDLPNHQPMRKVYTQTPRVLSHFHSFSNQFINKKKTLKGKKLNPEFKETMSWHSSPKACSCNKILMVEFQGGDICI